MREQGGFMKEGFDSVEGNGEDSSKTNNKHCMLDVKHQKIPHLTFFFFFLRVKWALETVRCALFSSLFQEERKP